MSLMDISLKVQEFELINGTHSMPYVKAGDAIEKLKTEAEAEQQAKEAKAKIKEQEKEDKAKQDDVKKDDAATQENAECKNDEKVIYSPPLEYRYL